KLSRFISILSAVILCKGRGVFFCQGAEIRFTSSCAVPGLFMICRSGIGNRNALITRRKR
ncbi:MAG: hypothetical protein ACU0A9_00670, partial [Alterinioella nitratireducens]|uniref:hypothetical protein n=1 Tax=Alterinioella nitratireducens TaxID=2735915 RepID=UPI0040584536